MAKLIAGHDWFAPGRVVHFLGRGGSLGSCYEARLLWEEGAKSEATALGTGSFRHGPQEIVVAELASRYGSTGKLAVSKTYRSHAILDNSERPLL